MSSVDGSFLKSHLLCIGMSVASLFGLHGVSNACTSLFKPSAREILIRDGVVTFQIPKELWLDKEAERKFIKTHRSKTHEDGEQLTESLNAPVDQTIDAQMARSENLKEFRAILAWINQKARELAPPKLHPKIRGVELETLSFYSDFFPIAHIDDFSLHFAVSVTGRRGTQKANWADHQKGKLEERGPFVYHRNVQVHRPNPHEGYPRAIELQIPKSAFSDTKLYEVSFFLGSNARQYYTPTPALGIHRQGRRRLWNPMEWKEVRTLFSGNYRLVEISESE